MITPPLFRLALLLAALLGAAFPRLARAQSAVPMVSGAPLLFLQRGQTIEITLSGQHLANVGSIAMPHPRGLDIGIVPPAKDAKPNDGQIRVKLAADAEAALGEREVRLVSALGVSAPLHVIVGQYPAIEEKEPNNTIEQPQDVALPATLMGRIDPPGDADCFRFTAIKGQKLVFDLHAMRAGSQLDPVLSVHDEAGRELTTHSDHHGGDPTVLFEVPADGKYVLLARDLQYRGGADFTYRIDAGPIPYVQAVLPMTAQPGKLDEVRAVGVNLGDARSIPLDLTYADRGEIDVRARTSAGMSNPMKVELSDLPAYVDEKPAHASKDANAVTMPIDISGHVDKGGDENFFKFHVAGKQVITLEAITKRMGSPMDPIITLRNGEGAAMQTMDNSAAPAAIITRELDAGDYQVSIRDLFFNGGPTYAYRLQIRPGVSAARQQGFSARFLPDAARISRGGNSVLFVDVQRAGDFKGDVTVTLDGLPPGVACPPLVMNQKLPGASGMLVLSAAGDAAIGSFPIKLRVSGFVGNQLVLRDATPVLNGKTIEQAYLTVLDAAPFTIEALADLPAARLAQLNSEADTLAAKLAAQTPQMLAEQAKWEAKVADPVQWETIDDPQITAAAGTTFTTLPDGSILAGNPSPERDTYTLVASSDVPGITAFRIEALPDPSLPNKGPGRNVSGNFVLSHFTVTVAPQDDPAKKTPVMLRDPRADFEQDGYPVIDSIEPKPGRGWAMYPRGGNPNQALFFTTTPPGDHNGAIFTFSLDQQFGQQHTLGRFRISFTTDSQAGLKSAVSSEIAKLLTIPADKRSPEQKAQITAVYRTIDPQMAADTQRLKVLRDAIGLFIERDRLQAMLKTQTPELDAQRDRWEKRILAGAAWLPVDFTSLKSQNGASLQKQPDGSIFVSGNNANTETYTLDGATSATKITAIRIEALPDPRLPGNGPGRAPNGNFVLTRLMLFASPKGAPEMNPPVDFKSATATFEQQGYAATGALDDKNETGWAIAPNFGKPAAATFLTANPVRGDASGTTLSLVLEHQFPTPQHSLGRFGVWVTGNSDPDAAEMLPPDILAALMQPTDKRAPRRKEKLNVYFRSIAPALEPIRRQLAEVQSQTRGKLTILRGREFSVPFMVNRPSFAGEVKVSLDGYIAGREPGTSAPKPITSALKFDSVALTPAKPAGDLKVKVEPTSGFGTRYCVLRAEAKVGEDTRVEYSAPFALYS